MGANRASSTMSLRTICIALLMVRDIVATLNQPKAPDIELLPPEPPKLDPQTFTAIVPMDVARLTMFTKSLAALLTIGAPRIQIALRQHPRLRLRADLGYSVAILANNGVLFSESAVKGAHFIELACFRRIPLLFLQNISEFMVGGKYEAEGIAKHGAKLVTAGGDSNGTQNHRTYRREFRRRLLRHVWAGVGPRFMFIWPMRASRWMGGRTAASVLATVRRRCHELDARGDGGFQGADPQKYEDEGNPILPLRDSGTNGHHRSAPDA